MKRKEKWRRGQRVATATPLPIKDKKICLKICCTFIKGHHQAVVPLGIWVKSYQIPYNNISIVSLLHI